MSMFSRGTISAAALGVLLTSSGCRHQPSEIEFTSLNSNPPFPAKVSAKTSLGHIDSLTVDLGNHQADILVILDNGLGSTSIKELARKTNVTGMQTFDDKGITAANVSHTSVMISYPERDQSGKVVDYTAVRYTAKQ